LRRDAAQAAFVALLASTWSAILAVSVGRDDRIWR
jgi:hypothetical protein